MKSYINYTKEHHQDLTISFKTRTIQKLILVNRLNYELVSILIT